MKRWLIPCVMLLLFCVTQVCANRLIRQQQQQEAATAWRGVSEVRYLQVSAFFEPQTYNEITQKKDLLLQSFDNADGTPLICFGGMRESLISYDKRQEPCDLYSVSPDFFQIHAFSVRNGSLFSFGRSCSEAILDRNAAWALFGSEQCIGEYIHVDDDVFRVCAVIEEPAGTVNHHVYGTRCTAWVPLRQEGTAAFCEAVLPEPVDGFAVQAMQQAFPDSQLVRNTDRFSLPRLWSLGKELLTGHQPRSVPFPPWEFAARQTELWLLLLWLFRGFLLIVFLFSCIAGVASFHPISRIRRWRKRKS